MAEDPATVAQAIASILDVPIPDEHPAIAELHRIASATRRVLEGKLPLDEEKRLLEGIASVAASAELPMWALDAMLEVLREPEPWPVPPLTYEGAQRRLLSQRASHCPICHAPVASDIELTKWENARRWNREDEAKRQGAAPLMEAAP
jgi:hypothetical protein